MEKKTNKTKCNVSRPSISAEIGPTAERPKGIGKGTHDVEDLLGVKGNSDRALNSDRLRGSVFQFHERKFERTRTMKN